MIQRGIVEQIIDKYLIQVRIPVYDKSKSAATGTKTSDLAKSIICTAPGTQVNYVLGDVVLVGFENNEISKPVILGLLYRATNTGSSISIDSITDTVALLEERIEEMKGSNIYCHMRYSNDNGNTFTSLYDYKDVKEITIDNTTYCTPNFKDAEIEGIAIDNSSQTIVWSILDSNNVDVKEDFKIETRIFNEDGVEIIIPWTDRDYLIQRNNRLLGSKNLYINFRIYATAAELSNYHISLSTDVNIPGTTYGDCLGLCVTTAAVAPTYPAAYNWSSFLDTIETLIGNYNDSLEPRVRRNELDLRNSDKTGLTDAIEITTDTIKFSRETQTHSYVENFSSDSVSFNYGVRNIGTFTTTSFDAPVIGAKTINFDTFVFLERPNKHLTIKVR